MFEPGETWRWDVTAPAPAVGDPNWQTVPGTCRQQAADIVLVNNATVTTPLQTKDDRAHHCVENIDIEKFTAAVAGGPTSTATAQIHTPSAGCNCDDPDDPATPDIPPTGGVKWTYVVDNTGLTPFAVAEVTVTDNIPGVTPVLDPASDVGNDDVLSPGEHWVYTATGAAEDLDNPSQGVVVVTGCAVTPGGPRPAYENTGSVTAGTASDSDPSRYCNPVI